MKKISSVLASAALLTVVVSSCNFGDFGDINKNPNKPSEAQTDMLFTYAC